MFLTESSIEQWAMEVEQPDEAGCPGEFGEDNFPQDSDGKPVTVPSEDGDLGTKTKSGHSDWASDADVEGTYASSSASGPPTFHEPATPKKQNPEKASSPDRKHFDAPAVGDTSAIVGL